MFMGVYETVNDPLRACAVHSGRIFSYVGRNVKTQATVIRVLVALD